MLIVYLVATILYWLVFIYFLVLWARLVVDLVRTIRRDWRPRGAGLVAIEAVYSLTDPPIRFFRRLVPRLSMGSVALDFGWTFTMLACVILLYIVGAFR